jgi:uncharacterized protein (DUF433 family)
MEPQQTQPVTGQHIELRSNRAGDRKAFIIGTRVSVENVYACHELQGMTPDQIVSAYPHLSLALVHAALAYYYEHADEIRSQMDRDQALADSLASQQGTTPFTALRDQLQSGKEVHDDPLSSG